MSSNSFLFINKDASSKSLTNNITETQLGPKSIHKHVQRLSARQRRQQAVNIGTDARAVVGWRNVSHPGSASKAVYIDNTQALADHKIAIDQASRQNGKKVAHGRTTKPAGKSSVHVKLASNPSSEDREDSISRSSDGLSKISASDSIVIHPTSRDLKPEYRRLSIRPPPDTLPNAPIKLTPTEHQVLEYYLREWMPSTTNLPRDCQLIGFTPVWPEDATSSTTVVQGAFQNSEPLSIWSLLAVTARRMQKVKHIELPELYSYKAVAALRKTLTDSPHISERMVLDLAYLILSDYHTDAHTRTDVYGKLGRDLIVRLGGLHKLQPFTARAYTAYDYTAAISSLTLPTMDPFRDVALFGLNPAMPADVTTRKIAEILARSEPRLRNELTFEHFLYNTFERAFALPETAFAQFKQYAQANTRKLYPIMAGSLESISSTTETCSLRQPSVGNDREVVLIADELQAQTRALTSQAWLWYVALSFLGYKRENGSTEYPWIEADHLYRTPKHILSAIPLVWQNLDRVQDLLQGTGWRVQHDRRLWFICLGYLLSATEDVQRQYRSRFVRQARIMSIHTHETLQKSLAMLAPLDRIGPRWLAIFDDLLPVQLDGGELVSV